jgi:hypothetical protein
VVKADDSQQISPGLEANFIHGIECN